MSGGHWDYQNDRACHEIFGWGCDAMYGMGKGNYQDNVKWARKVNPLENKMLSEMLYDMFCLMHSYDWHISGDTYEETYLKDVEYFKYKWVKPSAKIKVKEEIDKVVEETKAELYKTLGVHRDDR